MLLTCFFGTYVCKGEKDRDRYSAVYLKVVAHHQHIIYKELACKSTERE